MLKDYLYRHGTAAQTDSIIARFSSHKRWNFILANPEKASAEEFIIFYEELGITFTHLLEMGIGTLLSDTEKNFFTITYEQHVLPHFPQERPYSGAKNLANAPSV